jgi:hypothetical protein
MMLAKSSRFACDALRSPTLSKPHHFAYLGRTQSNDIKRLVMVTRFGDKINSLDNTSANSENGSFGPMSPTACRMKCIMLVQNYHIIHFLPLEAFQLLEKTIAEQVYRIVAAV